MEILVVKFGALGDVVRTSYFAEAIKRDWASPPRITWVTAPAAVDIVRFNPYVDRVVCDFAAVSDTAFDVVYSLDDEADIAGAATRLVARGTLHGACVANGRPGYTDSVAEWFDMGLLSRHGKQEADRRKLLNRRTHGEIFSRIFAVDRPRFAFHHSAWALERAPRGDGRSIPVGLCLFAGARWAAKSMRMEEAQALLARLAGVRIEGLPLRLMLLGAGDEALRCQALLAGASAAVRACATHVATGGSTLDLAALESRLALLVSADTLAMHLAVCQRVPTVAFFTVTSADEIDANGVLTAVRSTAGDYCSYRPDGDNSTITAERICEAIPWDRVAQRAGSLARTDPDDHVLRP